MNISSIVVQTRPENIEAVVEELKSSGICDYHFHDQKGRIIVTIEGKGVKEEIAKLKTIEAMPNIVCANMQMSYSEDELVGKSHNILRHPDMPKSAFKEMWRAIKSGETWSGCVKNMTKSGGFYWVYAEVSSVIKDGKIVEYKSMRSRIDRETKQKMQLEYDKLRESEEGIKRVCLYLSEDELEKII